MQLQQKYMEYQALQQQMQQIQKQVQLTADQVMEMEYIKESLSDMAVVKQGEKILCPISNGIFVHAKIEDPGKFYVNVGSGIVVKKDLDGAKKLMDNQKGEVENVRQQMLNQVSQLAQRLQEIEKNLMEMTQG